ncbi:MAG: hydrogenase formation protein HypD [archaeon]
MEDAAIIKKHIEKINILAKKAKKNITIMEICGGHTNVIVKYGIRDILPKNIRLISGPGCPVCVSSQHDIDCMISLAMSSIPIATYGDMMRVPGSEYSLEDAKAMQGNVFEVYSASEVLALVERYPNIVFFGVGFETTAPMTAYLLNKGICVYSVHKLVPPAISALVCENDAIDGFISPGHVSAIIGRKAYDKLNIASAISGFTPEKILRGISALLELIIQGRKKTINAYPEIVQEDGNVNAQKLLAEKFYVADSVWRGLGTIQNSGLEVKDDKLNAKVKYKEILSKVVTKKSAGCRCGDILKGTIEPVSCPLYKKVCTPSNPQGACMVSEEGTCSIYYRHGK